MRLIQATTVLAFLLVPVAAGASGGLFVAAEIPGEATLNAFNGQIEAKSVTISAAVTAGKPIIAPVVVTKNLDSASPKLLENLGNGRIIANLTISSLLDRSTTIVRAKYTMKNVRVVDYRLVDNNNNAPATEQVSFLSSNVTIEYSPIDNATGAPKGTIVGTINPAP